jgi:hypothetical protein
VLGLPKRCTTSTCRLSTATVMILGLLLFSLCRSALLPFIVVTTLQISPENRTVSLVWSCDFTVVLDWLPGGDAGPIPPDSSTTRSSGSLAARCPVILMLEASKGKGAGSMLQRRGSINIGGKRYWKRIEGVFWMRGSQQARGRSASAFGSTGGKATAELIPP